MSEDVKEPVLDLESVGFDSKTGKSLYYKNIITFNDILYPKYWTEELNALADKVEKELELLEDREAPFEERQKVSLQRHQLYDIVEGRYEELRSKDEIISDVKLVVGSITQENFQVWTEAGRELFLKLYEMEEKAEDKSEERLKVLKERIKKNCESYENCFNYIITFLDLPLRIFQNDEEYTNKVIDIVRARVGLWYVEPESSFLPVLHGKATDAIAKMTTKSSLLQVDPITHSGEIATGKKGSEVKGVIKNIDKIAGSLGVSTHKLLMTGVAQFTDINHTGAKAREVKQTEVKISFDEYAKRCGYDIEPHEVQTPEEKKKEANRVKSARKNARKKIDKDLELLYNFSLSWKEKVKGRDGDYTDVRLIDKKGIQSGYITMNFSKDFSDYLAQLPINQYPVALLGLDERKPNAYSIGLKLSNHFNTDNNIGKGTAQLLKVKTLLEYTDLPSIEEVRASKKSWEERIKEPFEKSLEALVACGLLEEGDGWYYCHSKGVRLSDEEAQHIDSYEVWEEILVKFTLRDAPDHRDRLEAKAERIEAQQKKKDKKTSKKK